jgi:DNA polymerase-3 subunit epsilon
MPGFEENRLLNELTYTVFDTETTGLNPKEDEIISIGALRIVNGRLLKEESFDRLVNPYRSIPNESIKYHGIQAEMLEGQPDINVTLPNFYNFAKDTVLIGHNAAFDMKMLQVKEQTTGISFKNPVLDTLLLSAVINPAQTNHNLEAIAKRLGIRIIGRHTALGDALTTGELFLKMVPLLEAKNVFTLKQAIEASKKTYYARLKY